MSESKEVVFQGYKISAYARQYLDEYWAGDYKITQDRWPIRESESVTYQRSEAAAEAHALVMGVRQVNECLVPVVALRSKVFRYRRQFGADVSDGVAEFAAQLSQMKSTCICSHQTDLHSRGDVTCH